MFNLFGRPLSRNTPVNQHGNDTRVDLTLNHIPLSDTLVNLYVVPINAGNIVYFNNRMTYTVTDEAFENLCAKYGVYQDTKIPKLDSIMPITSPYHIPSSLLYKCRFDDLFNIEKYLSVHDIDTKQDKEKHKGLVFGNPKRNEESSEFIHERIDTLLDMIDSLQNKLNEGNITYNSAKSQLAIIKERFKNLRKDIERNERYND